ncbi:glycosyltransferase family 4 protein [Bacillus sp. B1-b2]|uniref:glycosyltransferase family 4 protein n=1 Tax=Bacillus sp. B1-b2 TaxID=2653201 RepID=UPI001262AAB0|nr:glycosyltransferase family 4 protein [Bacillus sp. B1-b2]KAB7671697.1 glycosyltransferase family 4 protein [Bacillus sp. B1-b2]
MKLFMVGDFFSDTGPGVANIQLKKGWKNNKNVYFSERVNRFSRIIEMVKGIYGCDAVCFCSPSKANLLGIKLANIFNKKKFYYMHGYLTVERKLANPSLTESDIKKVNDFEKKMFAGVNKVFCVSKTFSEYMKSTEKTYAHKFDYNFNGLDVRHLETVCNSSSNRQINQIISIGGGMRRKNNRIVCKAIDKLNKEYGANLKFVVIGLPYSDKEEICQYDFVEYYDHLPHEKTLELLSESQIYIQNSSFETFGLGVIEALLCGCDLLISKAVGVIDIIDTLDSTDVIYNTQEVEEIANKILNVLKNTNNRRLNEGLRKDLINHESAAESLYEKIKGHI